MQAEAITEYSTAALQHGLCVDGVLYASSAAGRGAGAATTSGLMQPQLTSLPDILAMSRLYKVSKALNLAGKLGLFTTLCEQDGGSGGAGLSAAEVAAQLGLCRAPGFRGVHDWLDLLVSIGILHRLDPSLQQPGPAQQQAVQPVQGGGGQGAGPESAAAAAAAGGAVPLYCCSPLAVRYLVQGQADYMAGILALNNDRSFVMFEYLEEALRHGQVPPECFQRLPDIHTTFAGRQDGAAEFFARAMTGASKANFEALAARAQLLPWARLRSWADMGGSQGALCCAVASAHPHLRATTYDLPALHEQAARYVGEQGLSGRVADWDFFSDAPFPAGHDVISMGMVLHDWGRGKKRALMAKAYAALPPGGAFVAVDTCIDDARRERPLGLAMSLTMLLEFGHENSFDYSAQEFAGWAAEAGFSGVRCTHLMGSAYACVALK